MHKRGAADADRCYEHRGYYEKNLKSYDQIYRYPSLYDTQIKVIQEKIAQLAIEESDALKRLES